MGTIIVNEKVTLDGVMQDPAGDEGFERGGWFTRMPEADRDAWAKVEEDEAMAAEALLLGRRSYEFLARRFVSRTDAWGERMAALPKYVVSSTPTGPEWANAIVLDEDVIPAVTRLKEDIDGEIVVYGSGRLARTLLAYDLVDELRMTLCPFVIGSGERVFGDTDDAISLRLVDTTPIGDALTQVSYEVVRAA